MARVTLQVNGAARVVDVDDPTPRSSMSSATTSS